MDDDSPGCLRILISIGIITFLYIVTYMITEAPLLLLFVIGILNAAFGLGLACVNYSAAFEDSGFRLFMKRPETPYGTSGGAESGEPATERYFPSKAYRLFRARTKATFVLNRSFVKSSWRQGGWALFVIFKVCATYTFGMIMTAVLAAIYLLVISIPCVLVYAYRTFVKALDTAYLEKNGIATVCDTCKTRLILPGFKCPFCGRVHRQLQPNDYGVMVHRCVCGQKLPTTSFSHTQHEITDAECSRANLETLCSNPDCGSRIYGGDSHPVCISFVGGRAVGKTVLLTAIARQLVKDDLPSKGCKVSFPSGGPESTFTSRLKDFEAGRVAATIEPADEHDPSAPALDFRIKHEHLKADRMIHLFDIAGGTFIRGEEHEPQLQYAYSGGIVLVLDPFSITSVFDSYGEKLNETDTAAISPDGPVAALYALLAKVEMVDDPDAEGKTRIPLAIAIAKIDEPGIASMFDESARIDYLQSHPDVSDGALEDDLCRHFLSDWGMDAFLKTVDDRFAVVRYFACSAMGHSADGGAYAPEGVVGPVNWILSVSDQQLTASVMSCSEKSEAEG